VEPFVKTGKKIRKKIACQKQVHGQPVAVIFFAFFFKPPDPKKKFQKSIEKQVCETALLRFQNFGVSQNFPTNTKIKMRNIPPKGHACFLFEKQRTGRPNWGKKSFSPKKKFFFQKKLYP
jgi:hypothetical protein